MPVSRMPIRDLDARESDTHLSDTRLCRMPVSRMPISRKKNTMDSQPNLRVKDEDIKIENARRIKGEEISQNDRLSLRPQDEESNHLRYLHLRDQAEIQHLKRKVERLETQLQEKEQHRKRGNSR